jgi:hypothetical protein
MKKLIKYCLIVVAIVVVSLVGIVGVSTYLTENSISGYMTKVEDVGQQNIVSHKKSEDWEHLPAPVKKYFEFTFPEAIPAYGSVKMQMQGQFRLPLKENFNTTSAEQAISINKPALMFKATTPVMNVLWAVAYDAYIDGQMEMKAKICSTYTVMQEDSPMLSQISLQRWLLESPLYPLALLPDGPVKWEAIDEHRAKAVVEHYGQKAELVATFRDDGSLKSFESLQDGDLTTAYHGPGEYVEREDYRLVQGMMIPHKFSIARRANNQLYPFWQGHIVNIQLK